MIESQVSVLPPRTARARRRALPSRALHAGDSILLGRLRRGEEAAFAHWVSHETPRLLATARRLLRDEEDARDAVQEAFAQAFRALPSFAGHARLSTWLQRIAINAALMQLRRRKRRSEASIDSLLPSVEDEGQRMAPHGAWPRSETLDCERAELRQVMASCYGRLPERHRLVLLLRDVEGLDTAETAHVLGVGREAVKMRLHRARQALRTLLEPYVLESQRPVHSPAPVAADPALHPAPTPSPHCAAARQVSLRSAPPGEGRPGERTDRRAARARSGSAAG